MDMFAAAKLRRTDRAVLTQKVGLEIRLAQETRAVLLAGEAIALLGQLLPAKSKVLFWGPQEPGSAGGTIEIIIDPAGAVIYNADMGLDALELEDDLTVAQDYLAAALEDGQKFQEESGGLVIRIP